MTNFITKNKTKQKDSKSVPSTIAVVNLGMQQTCCYNHDGNENTKNLDNILLNTNSKTKLKEK